VWQTININAIHIYKRRFMPAKMNATTPLPHIEKPFLRDLASTPQQEKSHLFDVSMGMSLCLNQMSARTYTREMPSP
jgi:hypothetical protein